jgi:hypothetical protein
MPEPPDVPAESRDRAPDQPLTRDVAQPAARQGRAAHRLDRYDVIGAAIVTFLVALWVLHFVLPAPPPTNVP